MKIVSIFSILFVITVVAITQAQFTATVVSITGVTINAINGEPAKTEITIFDLEGKKINSTKSRINEKGSYFITGLKPGQNYNVVVTGKGFFKHEFELNIPNTDKYAEFSRDFPVKPLDKGVKIPFKVIPFDINKGKLREGVDYLLRDYLIVMKSNPEINFEIEVYPENESNIEIAQQRAKELSDYFHSKGVAGERIVTRALEKYDPDNMPPTKKTAKGKRYKGSLYLVVANS